MAHLHSQQRVTADKEKKTVELLSETIVQHKAK